MRIGVFGDPLCGRVTGIGRYVGEILVRLDKLMPDADFVLYSSAPTSFRYPSSRWHSKVYKRTGGVLGSNAWLKAFGAIATNGDHIDSYWATRTLLPGPIRSFPTVSTVYDLNLELVPAAMPLVTRWAHRLWMRRDIRAATRVVAISKGTSERSGFFYGRAADAVAYPGTSERFGPASASDILAAREQLRLPDRFMLAVGTREPRKNLVSLVQAWSALRDAGRLTDFDLVIAGAKGWRNDVGQDHAAGLHVLDYVPEPILPALYSAADLLVLPSTYEGFGIPVAEARACGTRIVATDIPELREAGGPAATYTAPDAEAIGAAILRALSLPPPVPDSVFDWDTSASIVAQELRLAARHYTRPG